MKTRESLVSIANTYLGCTQGSAKHKDLVDTFNKVKPHGNVGNYSCAWCAIAYSAWMIKAGFTKNNAALSYNCGTLISDAKKLGIWVEDDAYIPEPGDGIIYYWSDTGKGDCLSGASHVGMVVKVKDKQITVLEGNKGTSKTCGLRSIKVNSRYIRGYIVPKFTGTSYKINSTYTVKVDNLNVRAGASTSSKILTKKQLSKDAQKHCNKNGQLMKGTKVTCVALKLNGSDIWMKIPSGWICAYHSSDKKYYVK